MIGSQTKAEAVMGLTQLGTTEVEFKNSAIQVVEQISINDIAIEATRNIALTGDVTGAATYTLAGGISVETTVQTGRVDGVDIRDNSITTTQIMTETILNSDIANTVLTGSKLADPQRLIVRNAAGDMIFQLDGFGV